MPDILDSFVIEIGLDPKKLNQGQQTALADMRKFQEDALRSAKGIEESSRRTGEALTLLKNGALGVFAAVTGGKGIVDFIINLAHADAAVGRVSRSTGISASTISRWQGAARLLGGDAASMAQSFVKMNDALEGWKVGAGDPDFMSNLRGLSTAGGFPIDIGKSVEEIRLEIADNLAAIREKQGAGMAGMIGRRLGLDPALLDMLLKGRDVTKQILDQVNALGPATQKSADAAGELERRWNYILLHTEGTGRQAGIIPEILKLWDIANMTPGQAWDYFTNPKSKVTPAGTPWLSGFGSGVGQSGAFTSQADKEAFIRAEAAKRGIDPDHAMVVARSEGFSQFVGDQGTSFGAFQLHYKNNIPGLSNAGLGDAFTRDTGLQAGDPGNERATIQYALDKAKAEGWGAWHGWHGAPWAGINRGGAPGGSTTTTTVQINGPITIQAGGSATATDIAAKLRELGMRRAAEANQSSVGPE